MRAPAAAAALGRGRTPPSCHVLHFPWRRRGGCSRRRTGLRPPPSIPTIQSPSGRAAARASAACALSSRGGAAGWRPIGGTGVAKASKAGALVIAAGSRQRIHLHAERGLLRLSLALAPSPVLANCMTMMPPQGPPRSIQSNAGIEHARGRARRLERGFARLPQPTPACRSKKGSKPVCRSHDAPAPLPSCPGRGCIMLPLPSAAPTRHPANPTIPSTPTLPAHRAAPWPSVT